MAPCGNGLAGFSDESKRSILDFVSKQRCLTSQSVPTFNSNNNFNNNNVNNNNNSNNGLNRNPTQNQNNRPSGPTFDINIGNDNSRDLFIKLRSKAVDRMCLTLRKNNSKVGLNKCQGSTSSAVEQNWKLNSKTGYIHSAYDESKCLVPKLDADESSKKKRTRLMVDICPYYTIKSFQWRFLGDGYLANREKDTDGVPLVIQASRGLKQNGFNQEVLLIPTLSHFSEGNEYQKWVVIPV